MTTEITVKAGHGWPVRVIALNPIDNAATGYGGIVRAGETRSFHCHSSADLIVHEIQPGETDFAANMPWTTDNPDGFKSAEQLDAEQKQRDAIADSTNESKSDSS